MNYVNITDICIIFGLIDVFIILVDKGRKFRVRRDAEVSICMQIGERIPLATCTFQRRGDNRK